MELLKAATLAFLDISLEEYLHWGGRDKMEGTCVLNAGSCVRFPPGCEHTVAVQDLCLHDLILGHMK